LRVALAVAAGFTLNLATGEVIPFFGPVLAVQFLIFGAGPFPLSKAVAFVGLVLVVGQAFIAIADIFELSIGGSRFVAAEVKRLRHAPTAAGEASER
jgi:hypothetical protein